MSHHHHHHGEHGQKEGNIKAAFFLNLAFTLIELIGGLYTNSLAILSDAVHDLGDSLSLGLAWYFQNISKKGRTERFSFGFKRFSLLGAIINSIVLVTGSIMILWHAIPSLWAPNEPDLNGMLILAILGVLVNGAAVFKLRKGTSLNEKAVRLHLLEDVLGWVAVLIGSIVMRFYYAPWIDPLLSILIALFVLKNVYKTLKQSFNIILEGVPEEVDLATIEKDILALPEVTHVDDTHVWSLDGEFHLLTMRVLLDQDYHLNDIDGIETKIKSLLSSHQINHSTIAFGNRHKPAEH